MFFNVPGKPNNLKKTIYLFLATILGVLLSFLIHAFIEICYLSWARGQNLAVTFYGGCALPPALQIGLVIIGAVGGFFLGRYWWRKIYIERAWVRK